jgi:hypothetical protein
MKTLSAFLTIFLFSTGLFAQTFVQHYYKVLPGLGTKSQAQAIILTQDNNLFIAGPNNSSSASGNMYYIKTDTAGNVIQTTFSDAQFNDTYQTACRLMEDANSDFLMMGEYSYYHKTYFTRLSSAGAPLSTHVIGGQNTFQGGSDMVPMQDAGFLVASGFEVYNVDRALALRKLDTDGNFIWDTILTYPTPSSPKIYGNFDRMASIDDSTVVITGTRDYTSGSLQDLDMFLMKIRFWNDSVKILQFKIIEKPGTNEHGYDVLALPNNQGYIVCGDGANDNNNNYFDGIITRLDMAGNVVWKKTYTRAVNSYNRFMRVRLDNNGDIIVLARTNGGSDDVTLLKYSLNGVQLEVAFFDLNLQNETAFDMAIGPDNKIYVSAGTLYFGDEVKSLLLCVGNGTPASSPTVPVSDWALIMGILLIAVFMVVIYRKRRAVIDN